MGTATRTRSTWASPRHRFPGDAHPAAPAGLAAGHAAVYRRRRPTATPFYPIVQHHLETFLARAAEADPWGEGVAGWVEEDFRAYLRCGILAHGFARVRCDDCAAAAPALDPTPRSAPSPPSTRSTPWAAPEDEASGSNPLGRMKELTPRQRISLAGLSASGCRGAAVSASPSAGSTPGSPVEHGPENMQLRRNGPRSYRPLPGWPNGGLAMLSIVHISPPSVTT
jgi:hypothetical protein